MSNALKCCSKQQQQQNEQNGQSPSDMKRYANNIFIHWTFSTLCWYSSLVFRIRKSFSFSNVTLSMCAHAKNCNSHSAPTADVLCRTVAQQKVDRRWKMVQQNDWRKRQMGKKTSERNTYESEYAEDTHREINEMPCMNLYMCISGMLNIARKMTW